MLTFEEKMFSSFRSPLLRRRFPGAQVLGLILFAVSRKVAVLRPHSGSRPEALFLHLVMNAGGGWRTGHGALWGVDVAPGFSCVGLGSLG